MDNDSRIIASLPEQPRWSSQRIQEWLHTKDGPTPRLSFKGEGFSTGVYTRELICEPFVNVLASERVESKLTVGELGQLIGSQTGNHEPIRHVDAQLIAAEPAGGMARETWEKQ